jgi:hypothetical protein
MKVITSLIFILFMADSVFAQVEAKIIDYSNKLEINLEKESISLSLGSKISTVNVVDARADSGAVGYYYISQREAHKHNIKSTGSAKKTNDVWSKVYYCKPTLKDGLAEWINAYLQCKKNDSLKNKLLVIVKKLWLSTEADEIRFDNNKIGQAVNGWDAGVLCKFEFYLEKDSVFLLLYRIDTVYTFKDRLNDYAGMKFVDNAGFFVTSALKSSLSNLYNINPDAIITTRRKLLYNDISREYIKKNQITVLQTDVLTKGVYKNFEEFKSNTPSIKEFELRTGNMGDIMYVKEGNTDIPTRSVWGFCDGTNIFINSGDKYSQLIRTGNTFYFYGIKGIIKKSKHIFMLSSGLNYANDTGPKKTIFKADYKYYQIDMETGEAY